MRESRLALVSNATISSSGVADHLNRNNLLKTQVELIAERLGVPLLRAGDAASRQTRSVAGKDYTVRSWKPLHVEVKSVDGFQVSKSLMSTSFA